jgi:Glycosyltransferase family 87
MRVRPIVCINALLFPPAIVSLYAGIRNALSRSQDLQWSGAHLALQRVDPYSQYLRHDPEHSILLSQVPNYLHELYILLLPLGALSFSRAKPVWALINCLFAVLVVFLLRRIYELQASQAFLLLLLLISSTPCRIVLGAGQQSLFELFLFCLVFYFTKPTARGIALGVSYSKYSFSPVVFLYLFFRRQFRILAISFIAPLIGLLAMCLLVHRNPVVLSTEPLAVSRIGVALGLGDLMGIIQTLFHNILPESIIGKLMYAMALLASGVYTFMLSRTDSSCPRKDAAALAVASLMFFPHLTYDYVFLAIPVAAALSSSSLRWAKLYVLAAVALLWFGIKLVPGYLPPSVQLIEQIIIFLLLSGILMLLTRDALIPQSGFTVSYARDHLEEEVVV